MKTKIFTNCKETKLTFEFSKNKNRKEYYEENREEISKQQKEYRKEFPWKRVLINIKQRCNNLNNPRFKDYGGRGIECKITEEDLERLWYRDKAHDMDRPSIDRENNDEHYEYGNCRFIEKSLNSKKDKYKKVLQYDFEGKFIKEWNSQAEASKCLNINQGDISSVASGKKKTAGGFKWKLKNIK